MNAKKMLRRFLEFLARDAEQHPERLGDVGELIAGDDALLSERVPGMVYDEGYDRDLALRSVGAGWRPLVAALFDALPAVTVVQVKQKLGGLRVYLDIASDDETHHHARALIRAAELAARTTCEVCGARGELRKRAFLVTLCDTHAALDEVTMRTLRSGRAT